MSSQPVTPSQLLKSAATAEIGKAIERGISAMESGDNIGAAQAFAQATAVSAVYAAMTAFSMSVYYPVSGLSNALRTLSHSPGLMGKFLAKSGMVADPLVILRLENVAKSFSAGAAAAWMTSKAIDWTNELGVGGWLYDHLPDSVNNFFLAALNWVRPGDPLVLDLDADGIEATAIDPSNPTLFDHDADGIRTATGWIKADDGLLVLDLNANGLIDTGRELFGDNTLLPDGARAANGYLALAQHDANADGRIDSADPVFAGLRIWQDANQDAISQTGELRSLAQAGILSINVVGSASTITLGNGNSQPWSGSFVRVDGSSGASGAPELSGSLLLASNNFYREFTDDPALTPEALDLPQMGGSGLVRDLREAMSLGTPQAGALQEAVSAFATAGTREGQS